MSPGRDPGSGRTGTGQLATDQPTNPSGRITPPGWAYDPSGWSQRLPIVAVALVGAGIATYLALYQYAVVETVWEPPDSLDIGRQLRFRRPPDGKPPGEPAQDDGRTAGCG